MSGMTHRLRQATEQVLQNEEAWHHLPPQLVPRLREFQHMQQQHSLKDPIMITILGKVQYELERMVGRGRWEELLLLLVQLEWLSWSAGEDAYLHPSEEPVREVVRCLLGAL